MIGSSKKLAAFLLVLGLFVLLFRVRVDVPVEDQGATDFFIGEEQLTAPPISDNYLPVKIKDGGTDFLVPFEESIELSGFSIYFPGNLHSVSSYLPVEFDVYYKESGDWRLVEEVEGNKDPYYKFNIGENEDVSAFKVTFRSPGYGDTVAVSDLRFYKLEQQSLINGIWSFASENKTSLPFYTLFSLVIFIFLLIPGYAFLSSLSSRYSASLNDELKVVFAPLLSLLLLAVSSFVFILTGLDWVLYIFPVLALFSLVFFFKERQYLDFKKVWFPILVVLLAFSAADLMQALRDHLFNLQHIEKYLQSLEFIPLEGGYYGYHADNTLQWGNARAFLNKATLFSEEATKYRLGFNGLSFLDRTPFLSVVTVPILKVFGEGHFVYQRFLNVLMALYYSSGFLFLKRYFNQRISKITLLLMLLSGPLTFQLFNAEIYFKYFAFYPLFLALYFYLRRKDFKYPHLRVGALLAISYLIHPITLFFAVPLFLLYLKEQFLNRGLNKESFLSILKAFSPLFVTFSVWALVVSYLRSEAPEELNSRGNIYVRQLTDLGSEVIKNKLLNAVNLFVPDFQTRTDGLETIFSVEYLRAQFLKFSLFSYLSPVFLVILFWKLKKLVKDHWKFLWLALAPLALFLLLFHGYSFGAYSLLYPVTVPLLLALVVNIVKNYSLRLKSVVFGSYLVFMIFPFYYLSGIRTELLYYSHTITLIKVLLVGLFLLMAFSLISLVRKEN